MFQFSIYRIPVRVEPWFWIIAFLLGGGTSIRERDDIIGVLVWMAVVFISILIHELGHAVISRKLTGKNPAIKLWAMGGLAYSNASLTRSQSLKVSLAGPAAGIAFFLVIWSACIAAYGMTNGTDVIIWNITHVRELLQGDASAIRSMSPQLSHLIYSLIFINFWWSLANLLPVLPLDGGQAYAAIESSQRRVYQVGMITGITTALLGFLILGSFYIAILFGFLAYQNLQQSQQIGTNRW